MLLTKVPNLIMRGALVHKLGESSIEVYVPDRDAIVNVGTSPNLSLEGYSAVFDGYSVYVPKPKLPEAQAILNEIEAQANAPSLEQVDHASKFYFSSVMSFLVPGIMHVIALYHFALAYRKKQTLKFIKTVFSIFVLICSAMVLWAALSSLART